MLYLGFKIEISKLSSQEIYTNIKQQLANMNIEKVINLEWKDGDFVISHLRNLKLADGKYKIVTTDITPNASGVWNLTKIGSMVQIYLKKFANGETVVYKSFKIETEFEILRNFLISKCPDVQKVMNIFNFFTDIKVGNLGREINEIVGEPVCDRDKSGDKPGKPSNKPPVCGGDKPKIIEEINFKMMERFMGRNFPVKGNVQSGKTQFMIACAIFFMLNGKSSLVILRNYTDDSDQLKIRVKQFANELYLTLENSGFSRNLFPIEFADEDKITPESLNGTTPKILISIYNNTNLAKINKKIGENEKGKFVLFIDEADMLHKDVELTEMTKNGDLTVASELQNLVNTCFCSFSVSGTILDAILKNSIKVEDLIVLQPPAGYKNHNTFQFDGFTLTKKCKFTTLESDDIVKNDENIIPFLEYFSKLKYKDFTNAKHPNYCLMRVSKVKKPMNKFFDMICKEYRSICVILYTGDDIKLHHDSLENVKSIRLSNGKISQNESDIHVFKKGSSPGHILEWLKNNGGAEVFSNIITIAGDLASRGISFGSADFKTCEYPWHLTNMYATFADTTDIPEMIQITGRLCTVPKLNITLQLHVTQSVRENITKGFNLTEEFVARAANVREKSQSVNDYVRTLNIFKNKVPDSDRPLTKFTKFTPKKVRTLEEDTKNGGWMTDEKGRYIVRIVKDEREIETLANITKEGPVFGTIVEGAYHPDPDDDDPLPRRRKPDNKPTENSDIKEIDGVKVVNLKRWLDDNCSLLVAQMMKFLYEENRTITFEEFKSGINYTGSDIQFQHNIDTGRGKKCQNGQVWINKNKTITLNPSIKKYIDNL